MAEFVPVVGNARRSQGIFTFGTGAVVDFTRGSFMPLGIEHMDWRWSGLPNDQKNEIAIHEPRLERLLKVHEFRGYPLAGEKNLSDFGKKVARPFSVPCVRFPEWLECPLCHRLGREFEPFEVQPDGRVVCKPCKTDVNPVRFVTACEKHHIEDFPWVEWTHQDGKVCARPILYLKSRGRSVALSDLFVECSCKEWHSLGEIFRPAALKTWPCTGKRPWLQRSERCGQLRIVLQRGASNVHFSVAASMLSIPPASESMSRLFDRDWTVISSVIEGFPEEIWDKALSKYLAGKPVDPAAAIAWIKRRKKIETDPEGEDELSCRYQEFRSLGMECLAAPGDGEPPEFENVPFQLGKPLEEWVTRCSAVRRLREVRAYCGFTRVNDVAVNIEQIPEDLQKGIIAPLSSKQNDWYPAVEVRGEGIFLQLSESKIAEWSKKWPAVVSRAKKINSIFKQLCEKRGYAPPYEITARRLLVHGLAHALLRRLSLDCGYSSASLRERLYVSDGGEGTPAMAGLLIYTASPDSDGSLGGLVNLATPERLGPILKRTIADLAWCGSDPVCIETRVEIQGDRLAGACCHGCLLVPETACECFNRELDRTVLIGSTDPEESFEGFFSGFPAD